MTAIQEMEKCSGIDEYLTQFDLHTHAFSHCVLRQRNISDPEIEKMTERDKLRIFSNSLDDLCTQAINKGVKILGVADHPQFLRYNLKYRDFIEIFRRKRKKFPKLKIVQGIEADIKADEEGKIFVDLENITDGEMDFDAMAGAVNYIIGSLHHKDFKKHSLAADRKTYLKFIIDSITALAELKRKVRESTGEEKPVILGHPYCIIGETNYKHHDNSPHLKEKYQTKREYLESQECLIKPFDSDDLGAIALHLIENKIMTEINGQTIRKGFCDIRKTPPFYKTITEGYIECCTQKSAVPAILVNSDAHRGEDVASFELEIVRKNIKEKNIEKIRIPYEKFLR
jgi:histidinol phosphatase-like PHP family hydrolase